MKLLPILLSSALLAAGCAPVAATSPPIHPQKNRWRHYAVAAKRAQEINQHDQAISLWQQALGETTELGADHPWYSVSLRNLGILTFDSGTPGHLEKAHEYFVRERDSLKHLGADYQDRILPLSYLGTIETLQGYYQSSSTNLQEAIILSEKYGTTTPGLLARIQVPLLMTGKEDEARDYRHKTNEMMAQIYPEPTRQAAGMLKLAESIEKDASHVQDDKNQPFYRVSTMVLTDASKLVPYPEDEKALEQRGLILLRRAQAFSKLRKYKEACIDARDAMTALQKTKLKMPLILAVKECAWNINARGVPTEAIHLQERAIKLLESMNPRPEAELKKFRNDLKTYTRAAAQAKPTERMP